MNGVVRVFKLEIPVVLLHRVGKVGVRSLELMFQLFEWPSNNGQKVEPVLVSCGPLAQRVSFENRPHHTGGFRTNRVLLIQQEIPKSILFRCSGNTVKHRG